MLDCEHISKYSSHHHPKSVECLSCLMKRGLLHLMDRACMILILVASRGVASLVGNYGDGVTKKFVSWYSHDIKHMPRELRDTKQSRIHTRVSNRQWRHTLVAKVFATDLGYCPNHNRACV